MSNKILAHRFTFNKNDHSDEQLHLITEFFNNGDGEIFGNQELKLQSCCNHTSFCLFSFQLTPEVLRELANELDKARNEASFKCSQTNNTIPVS